MTVDGARSAYQHVANRTSLFAMTGDHYARTAEQGIAATDPNRPKRRFVSRIVRWTAAAMLAGGIAFAGGFGLFADYVSSLATPHNPEPADAIIVVTGGYARLQAAVNLLKSGKGERLLISGVHPAADLDDLRAVTGGDRRLFGCCVDVDYEALDTIGNAQESAKWLKDHNYERALLVTNNYHMPRTLLEMHRAVPDTEFVPYPVVITPIGHGAWLTKAPVLRVLFTEYTKYLAALARSLLPIEAQHERTEMVSVAPTRG